MTLGGLKRCDRRVSVSIVSHRQGAYVRSLLSDLQACEWAAQLDVLVTINLPEDDRFLTSDRFARLTVIRNRRPRGFSENHNAAFRQSRGDVFLVLNPDVRLGDFRFSSLLETLDRRGCGVCAPAVWSPSGRLEDSVRPFPTLTGALRRGVQRRGHLPVSARDVAEPVDWVAGMFMLFRREAFVAVGGFDERYFLYYEDVDICWRLHQAGWAVWYDPREGVIHEAQRTSHRNARYLAWHVQSAARYFWRTARAKAQVRARPEAP